ncbi:MAG TPA: DNA polymerase III subunit delta' [Rubrivivax sp.]
MVVGEDGALPLPWLRAPLDDALGRQRAHALLVHGAPGIGALEFALVLAQAWLCEAPGDEDIPRPCGRCASCRLVQARSHPDLKLRVPEELALSIDWPVSVDEKRKPSRQIRIDEVRDATDWVVTTPARGRAKVLVLHPAEAMNPAAASALLKTLEEPPAGARLVLSAAEPASLMPTIRSRCQQMTLGAPSVGEALAWLAGQGVADGGVLLAGAGGRVLDALALHREGLTAAVWAGLPASVARGQAGALAGWPVPRMLDTLQKLCHDAMVAAVGGVPRFFPAASVPASASLPALDLWRRGLQRVRRNADHPWSEPLLFDALVAEGRAALAPAASSSARSRSEETALDTLKP